MSLAKARERHLAARQRLVDGADPSHERRIADKTFEEVARQWHTHWKADRDERHAHYVLKRLEADVFPEIGSLSLANIPTSAFRDAVQKIEQRGAADIAKRVLQTCGQIMRYAMANDLAAHNPVAEEHLTFVDFKQTLGTLSDERLRLLKGGSAGRSCIGARARRETASRPQERVRRCRSYVSFR